MKYRETMFNLDAALTDEQKRQMSVAYRYLEDAVKAAGKGKCTLFAQVYESFGGVAIVGRFFDEQESIAIKKIINDKGNEGERTLQED